MRQHLWPALLVAALLAVPSPGVWGRESGKGLAAPGSVVAILDLFNLSTDSAHDSWETLWGRGLRRAAFSRQEIKVVPFPRLDSAIKELKIDPYYIAPEQAPEIAKKVQADLVVLGSFNVSDAVIAASLKVVDGKTGKILEEETRFGSDKKPQEFMADLSATLAKMLFGEVQPAPEAPKSDPAATAGEPAPSAPLPTATPVPETSSSGLGPVDGPVEGVEIERALTGAPVSSQPNWDAPPPRVAPIQQAPFMTGAPPPPASQLAPSSLAAETARAGVVAKPIESELPSLPRAGGAPLQQIQSPFQPLPVLPAPPPPRSPYTQPAPLQQGPPMQPMTGPAAQGGGSFGSTPQQAAAPPSADAPEAQGPVRRFFSWVTRPFRPGQFAAPPPPVSPEAAPGGAYQQAPQAAPTPPPSGNPITRFFGRIFGRSDQGS